MWCSGNEQAYKQSKNEFFEIGGIVETFSFFQMWERAGVEPAREVIRRIYSPMLSTDQPSFLYMGQLLGIEPSAVESQSTILPINYSCRRTYLCPLPDSNRYLMESSF